MITIIDNFLTTQEHSDLEDAVLGEFFPWFYSAYKSSPKRSEDDFFQFSHLIYDRDTGRSKEYKHLEPLLNKMNIESLRRVKLNITTRDAKANKLFGYHTDFNSGDSLTAIYYINETNGKTFFEFEDVLGLENRLIKFPVSFKHSGGTHTDKKIRAVVNINYYEKKH